MSVEIGVEEKRSRSAVVREVLSRVETRMPEASDGERDGWIGEQIDVTSGAVAVWRRSLPRQIHARNVPHGPNYEKLRVLLSLLREGGEIDAVAKAKPGPGKYSAGAHTAQLPLIPEPRVQGIAEIVSALVSGLTRDEKVKLLAGLAAELAG